MPPHPNRNRKRIWRNVGLLTLMLIPTAFCQVSGSVSGTVIDPAGNPVRRARIFISQDFPPGLTKRPVAPPVITGPNVVTTMSDRTGAFTSGHLPNGRYIACAEPETEGFLNPCHWSTAAPTFTVANGKTVAGVKVTVAKGAILSIHVDDPHQLLAQPNSVIAPDLMFHVVTAKGHRYPARIVASSATSRDHTITIPFGAPITVKVFSPNLVINDTSGKPAAVAGAAVSVPTTAAGVTLTYTVTGAKQ
jgi:hypothetical protein